MSSPFQYAPAPESRSIVDIKPAYGLFIDGEFVDGSGDAFKTVNPATEEVLTEVSSGSAATSTSPWPRRTSSTTRAGPTSWTSPVSAPAPALSVWPGRSSPGTSRC